MMMNSPAPADAQRKSWADRVQALFEIFLMSGIVSTLLASIPLLIFNIGTADSLIRDSRAIAVTLLLESLFSFAILAFLLQLHREPISSLGLSWNRWKHQVLLGFCLIPLLFIVNIVVAAVFKVYFPEHYLEENPLSQSIQSAGQLALFIFSALVAGAIKEEVQRAFILNRFRDYLGGGVTGLIIWSIVFGAGHYVQGYQGVVTTAILGAIFGIAYLKTGSLIGPMVAHGTYNTLALLAYWFIAKQ